MARPQSIPLKTYFQNLSKLDKGLILGLVASLVIAAGAAVYMLQQRSAPLKLKTFGHYVDEEPKNNDPSDYYEPPPGVALIDRYSNYFQAEFKDYSVDVRPALAQPFVYPAEGYDYKIIVRPVKYANYYSFHPRDLNLTTPLTIYEWFHRRLLSSGYSIINNPWADPLEIAVGTEKAVYYQNDMTVCLLSSAKESGDVGFNCSVKSQFEKVAKATSVITKAFLEQHPELSAQRVAVAAPQISTTNDNAYKVADLQVMYLDSKIVMNEYLIKKNDGKDQWHHAASASGKPICGHAEPAQAFADICVAQ